MLKHDDFIADCNHLCQSFYGVKDKSLCTEEAWEPDWEIYAKRCCWEFALCKVETVRILPKPILCPLMFIALIMPTLSHHPPVPLRLLNLASSSFIILTIRTRLLLPRAGLPRPQALQHRPVRHQPLSERTNAQHRHGATGSLLPGPFLGCRRAAAAPIPRRNAAAAAAANFIKPVPGRCCRVPSTEPAATRRPPHTPPRTHFYPHLGPCPSPPQSRASRPDVPGTD
jgi:hypothetical protein